MSGAISIADQVRAVRATVGLLSVADRAIVRVSGDDRLTWLQGLLTNDLLTLDIGAGRPSLMLSVQGHIVTELRAFSLTSSLLLDLPRATLRTFVAALDHYLIAEDVEIEDESDSQNLLSIQGPYAGAVLTSVLGLDPPPAEWRMVAAKWQGVELHVVRASRTGEDGFDLVTPREGLNALFAAMRSAVEARGGVVVTPAALNALEIEAGIPRWGAELDASIVPLEARLDDAISRTKGCYVGQEIIARIDARGQVNNLLTGLTLDGGGAAARDEIRVGTRVVGRITRATVSPTLGRPVALAFLRREFQEPGTRVVVGTASGEVDAAVTPLPFVPHRAGVA